MKLKVGDKAPDFKLPSHLDKEVVLSELRGSTIVLAFFPQAWTPVWTSQIPSYEAEYARFTESNVQVLGISIDHVPCLKAWAESMGGITYPLLSDFWPHGEVALRYGVLRSEGYTERAIFIIDKEGIIQYIDIHAIDDQPSNEVLFNELARIVPNLSTLKSTQKSIEEELPQGGVVMFCTSWCPGCRKARKWLAENQIEYVEVDVGTNQKGAAQVRKWANGNLVTPTFDIDGTIIVDWDEEKVAGLLRK